jgi:hypothetical protein
MKKAQAMVRRDGGEEIRVKNRIGKVVESKTVRGSLLPRRLRLGG